MRKQAPLKTTTLTFSIEPALKDAVRTAADSDHLSIANLIEVMIPDYCGRVGVVIHDTPARGLKDGRNPTPRKQQQPTTLQH